MKWWIVVGVSVIAGGLFLAGKDDIRRFRLMKRMYNRDR